jgi:hypothetical protein
MKVWVILDHDDVDVLKYAFLRKKEALQFVKDRKAHLQQAEVIGPLTVVEYFGRVKS